MLQRVADGARLCAQGPAGLRGAFRGIAPESPVPMEPRGPRAQYDVPVWSENWTWSAKRKLKGGTMQRHVSVLAGAATALGIAVILAGAPADEIASRRKLDTGYAWFDAGQAGQFPAQASYEDSNGSVGVIVSGGPVEMKGHPFFTPLGTNGRACVTCHQPSNGMSVSAASLRQRWQATHGKDPVFAAVDGSNCPSLPQDQDSS